MVYYKNERRAYFKWALGIIILVLGLTLTFSDVYGFNFPSKGKQSNTTKGTYSNQQTTNQSIYTNTSGDYLVDAGNNYDPSDKPPPPSVPEPGTLILLGSGLAGMLIKLRRKK